MGGAGLREGPDKILRHGYLEGSWKVLRRRVLQRLPQSSRNSQGYRSIDQSQRGRRVLLLHVGRGAKDEGRPRLDRRCRESQKSYRRVGTRTGEEPTRRLHQEEALARVLLGLDVNYQSHRVQTDLQAGVSTRT